jgi:dolichyl-phosphate-mannose-protein mannosyltransferase
VSQFLKKYHYLLLIIILCFAFLTRIVRLHVPERYVFDEVYHALTAKLIARDDVRAYEWWNPPVEKDTAVDWLHPPYAKYTQAFFIKTFGENSFGWRISSVIFGVLVIVMVYKLSYELFNNKNLSLLATLLASLDGLLLVQSRIAMNDIHVTFFILLTFLFYIRYKNNKKIHLLLLTGLSAGLAIGTKWSGLFALLTVLFFEGIEYLKVFIAMLKKKKSVSEIIQLKKVLLLFISLGIIPIVMYLLSYSHMFLQGKSLLCFEQKQTSGKCYFERIQFGDKTWEGYLSHFGELHRQIWWYQTNLEATHSYQSRPYQWFLNLRPVWMHVNYQDSGIGNIYAQGNSILFWTGGFTALLSVVLLITQYCTKLLRFVQKKRRQKRSKKTTSVSILVKKIATYTTPNYFLFLLFAYFAVWLPWQLSPRIMFFYHYTPAVPLLTIILAYWLIKISTITYQTKPIGKYLFTVILLLISVNFIVFYPNWTALVLPKGIMDPIYFALQSWK